MDDTAIICLSSIPPRFDALGPTVETLLAQTANPTEVRLYVPKAYNRFPNWDGRLPSLPHGARICRTDRDLGPATKIIPALQTADSPTQKFAYCDDDCLYPQDWLSGLLMAAKKHPDCAITAAGDHLPGLWHPPHRRPRMKRHTARSQQRDHRYRKTDQWPPIYRQSGFCDTATGWGGTLVQPRFFSADVAEIPAILWSVDDYWLSAHLARSGIGIWLAAEIPAIRRRPGVGNRAALVGTVVNGHDRTMANDACINHARQHWNIWKPAPAWWQMLRHLRNFLIR